jgi:hypothetical protein
MNGERGSHHFFLTPNGVNEEWAIRRWYLKSIFLKTWGGLCLPYQIRDSNPGLPQSGESGRCHTKRDNRKDQMVCTVGWGRPPLIEVH